MKRQELEHVVRASAAIANETSFVVVGSQAVLLPFPDAPVELLMSHEVDLYPALHPERAELISGAIGEMSLFHDTFGYHADGVGPETAVMPIDWMDFCRLDYLGEVTVVTPDLHDLAVSKCVAGRDKDAVWITALLRHRMIEPRRLLERIEALDPAGRPIQHYLAFARRRIEEAGS